MDNSNIPYDADGNVIRNLLQKGFDFSKEYEIDFNVDFHLWPPNEKALVRLQERFPNLEIFEGDEREDNYILLRVSNRVSYDFVVKTQNQVTNLVSEYGGYCDSWGVLH